METTSTVQYEVLDNTGLPTGKLADQSTVHSQQLWHGVVNVWVVNSKGELLMQLRAPGVELSPNLWDVSTGSHVRPGESPAAAAQRCLQTELGIAVSPEELKHLFNIQCKNPLPNGLTHNVFGHVFLVQQDIDTAATQVDPAKITQLAWVPLMQLMSDVGNDTTRQKYLPRANNYYPQLFTALQAWLQ
ncbi:MAG TPA: NUDIX domain-containing protein [Candidatus Saccharimonadales bacterium]|nr:NUDIX domain-containing protein [Candidatus Saccharimonadales bacterium]